MLIDDVYNEIIPDSIKNKRNISESKLSDSESITISIIGESLTLDSEKVWFYFLKKRNFEVYFLIFVIEQDLIRLKEIYKK